MARIGLLVAALVISTTSVIGCASNSMKEPLLLADAPVVTQLAEDKVDTLNQKSVEHNEEAASAPSEAVAVPESKQLAVAKKNDVIIEVVETETKENLVCQNVKITGTRFPRRICMTQQQRNDTARESQQWLSGRGSGGSVQSVHQGLVDPKNKSR